MEQDFTTLIELVKRYSPSGQEEGAVAYLIERMRELGYTRAWRDEVGNAIGVMGEGERQIVLLGHIDTVPGEIEVALTPSPRPFAPAQGGRGGRGEGPILHGRGAVDAKGPLAAFVDAVARVGAVPGWQFVVVGAVDEERESVGARHIVAKYRPEYAIIGEPNRWDRIALGYKGSAWAEVTVRRSLAHSAAQAASAPEIAVEVWERIRAWAASFNAGRARAFDQVAPTLRGFTSQEGSFEETATLRIGVRLSVDFPPEAWYALLEEKSSEVSRDSEVAIAVARRGFPIPAWRGERRNPLARAFLGAIREAGGKPAFVLKTGTADVNVVAPAWDCPAVVYGPGDSSLDHTPEERLSLEEYARAVGVLERALRRLTASRATERV